MNKGQKINHSIYGVGVIDEIYQPNLSCNFKGGILIKLLTEKGITNLNYNRDNLYAKGNNIVLSRVFEGDRNKITKL